MTPSQGCFGRPRGEVLVGTTHPPWAASSALGPPQGALYGVPELESHLAEKDTVL